jgi:membrane protease YdiL (CAAX protease family)
MSVIKAVFWNEPQARLRAGWRLAVQLVLNSGLYLLGLSLLRPLSDSTDTDSSWATVILALIMVGVTLFAVSFTGRLVDRRQFSDFGLHLNRGPWWADFAFGLVLGVVLPLGLALVGLAMGLVRFEPAFTSGFPELPFGLAVLLLAFVYLCVGTFEELGRAYHLRNLFEGTAHKLGTENAAVLAVIGASVISVLMHLGNGNFTFLIFVLLAAAIKGLLYLLTGRVGIALSYHAAWDFTMATVLGIGAQSDASDTTAFYAMRFDDAAWASAVDSYELTLPILSALLGLELAALLLMLGWIRLRYGNVKLREDLATPRLLSQNWVR